MSESDSGESITEPVESDRNQRLVRIGLLMVALVVAVVAADVVLGLGFLTGDTDGEAVGTPTSTPVPTLSASPTAGDRTETATPGIETGDTRGSEESAGQTEESTPTTAAGVTVRGDTRQFQFEVHRLESCGQTCRDAYVELTNSGEAATDVAATSRLYAGKAGDDKVWEGTERIGDMAADQTVQRTVRIELSLYEASKVCNADTVTLVTVVASADHKQQFTSHPDVGC